MTLFPVACFGVEGAPCGPCAECETQVRCSFRSETISLFARCRCTSHLGLPGNEVMLKENTIRLCFCDNKTSVRSFSLADWMALLLQLVVDSVI